MEREGTDNGAQLGRRQFMVAGTGAVAALMSTGTAPAGAQPAGGDHGHGGVPSRTGGRTRLLRSVVTATFPQPVVYTASRGVLEVSLAVNMLPGRIRAYNGNIPGPTLRVKAGDTLNILLLNQLPPNPGGALDFCGKPNAMDNPHCFNTTNLHTHGLHVSPLSKDGVAGDDVLIEVPPGGTQPYCIPLPSFHAPGTHWYHAHKHGSAALQLANGLCGALIVEEPDDQRILPAAHKDYVWIIQEVLANADAQLIYTQGMPPSQFLVNGQLTPTLTVLQGEVQRWRFVNAAGTPRGLCQLVLTSASGASRTLYQIAMDGISFYGKAPQPTTALNLGNGNRADVLVKLTQPGTYTLVRKDYPWGGGGSPNQVLATINVLASPLNMTIPAVIPGTPPNYLQPVTQVDPPPYPLAAFGAIQPGTAWQTTCPGVPQPPTHPTNVPFPPPAGNTVNLLPSLAVINCTEYMPPPTPDAPPGPWDMFQPKLNAAQQWVLTNVAGASHPFHVHVNPFQVMGWKVDPNGPDDPTNWMWMDTVPILPIGQTNPPPWFQNNQVNIRTRFTTYYGRYVLHCHILVHEDMGMMANINVIDDGTGVGPCQKI